VIDNLAGYRCMVLTGFAERAFTEGLTRRQIERYDSLGKNTRRALRR